MECLLTGQNARNVTLKKRLRRMPKVKIELNNHAKKNQRSFVMPREGLFELIVEFAAEFFPVEENLRKVSIKQAYDFIDRFTNKHFVDIDEEE